MCLKSLTLKYLVERIFEGELLSWIMMWVRDLTFTQSFEGTKE